MPNSRKHARRILATVSTAGILNTAPDRLRMHHGPPHQEGPVWKPVTPMRGPFSTPVHSLGRHGRMIRDAGAQFHVKSLIRSANHTIRAGGDDQAGRRQSIPSHNIDSCAEVSRSASRAPARATGSAPSPAPCSRGKSLGGPRTGASACRRAIPGSGTPRPRSGSASAPAAPAPPAPRCPCRQPRCRT